MGVISAIVRPVYAIGQIVSSTDRPTEEQIKGYIKQVFAKSGSEAVDWGLRVAKCESGYNPFAYNEKSGTWGIYQFKIGTFLANSERAGIENANINNWIQQVETAHFMFSIGQKTAWECE